MAITLNYRDYTVKSVKKINITSTRVIYLYNSCRTALANHTNNTTQYLVSIYWTQIPINFYTNLSKII